MYIYIYIYTHTHINMVCMYIYIYIYIHICCVCLSVRVCPNELVPSQCHRPSSVEHAALAATEKLKDPDAPICLAWGGQSACGT